MSVFGGDQWRPLLHVNDVANAIDVTIETKVNGIFNLHYQNFKIIEIAEEIEKKITSAEIIKTPLEFQDARNYQVTIMRHVARQRSRRETCARALRTHGTLRH